MAHEKRNPGLTGAPWKSAGERRFHVEFTADLAYVLIWLAIVIWTFVGGGQ